VLLLAGLSTGHKVGLAVVAAVFIAFALGSSFLAPRWRPDFPGKQGLSVFVIACVVLFAAMITAVEVFGGEGSEAKAESAAAQRVAVKEKEFTIVLAKTVLEPGKTTFVVSDVGKLQHDLALKGPGVNGKKTPLINPGSKASLTVRLAKGKYTLWCTVPGHRKLGMVATLTVR
jgi:uncharacterized cupredoxin-like copper-binding protein